ncbi:MAG: hypothetical protein K0R54_1823 [Clostridiaceae bacterium]|jgi:hypothetical protein|nr:hypothetical protein [Clostridiaceae bacterium]
MNNLTMSLKEFLEDVYKIDLQDVYDCKNFYMDYINFNVETSEIEMAKKVISLQDIESLKELIVQAKNRRYEDTYMFEYLERYESELASKIENDFKNLIDFFGAEIEENGLKNITEKDLKVTVDWVKDTIRFTGKLSILDCILVEAINGYGSFYFENIKEFKEYESKTKNRIIGHMHWLKYMESIYGTIYNFFRFNAEYIGKDYILGDTDLDEAFIKEQFESVCA